MSTPLHIAVVVASTRPGRFGPTVATWFAGHVERHLDMTLDLIDLAEVPVPSRELSRRIDAADGVVIVVPEYNHSFPGPLKTAIDSLRAEWAAKPVGFVSYGGISGGLRAVEALRPVFAELHAMTIRETVSFANAWEQFDGSGQPKHAEAVDPAAERLLAQLSWWARALRTGRTEEAYAA